jgi:hypothetical protein
VSYRTTATLLALLIVLGGVVYYVTRQPAPDQASQTAATPQVLSFAPTDATKLVVSSADKTTEVAKTGTTWNVVRPEAGPADASRVEGWVDQLGSLTASRAIDNVTDFSSYGLSQPKGSVEIDLTGGKTIKLALGDKTPDGGDYYVRMPDDTTKSKSVFLINAPLVDDLNSALTKPPKALPTPTPLPTLVPGNLTPPPTPAGTPTAAASGG